MSSSGASDPGGEPTPPPGTEFAPFAAMLADARVLAEARLDAAIAEAESSPPAHAGGLRRAAVHYRARGRHDDAVSALERALEAARAAASREEIADTTYTLGRLSLEAGEIEKAAQLLVAAREFEAELKRQGQLPAFLADLGSALLRRRRSTEAKKVLDRALGMATGPALAAVLEALAELQADERRWGEAERTARRWTEVAEEVGDQHSALRAWRRLGACAQRRRNGDAARSALARAVELADGLDDLGGDLRCRLLIEFAEVCRRTRLLRRADEAGRRAVALADELGSAALRAAGRETLAAVLRDRRDFPAAVACLTEMLAVGGDDGDAPPRIAAEVREALAQLLGAAGEPDRGEQEMRAVVEEHRARGDDRATFYAELRLGDLLLEFGRVPRALAAFERALKLAGDDGPATLKALAGKARALERQGDWKWAIVVLDRRLELFRAADDAIGEAQTLLDIARVHRADGRTDQARYTLEQALRVTRGLRKPLLHARVLEALGNVAAADGDSVEALELLDEAAGRFLAVGRGRAAIDVLAALERVLRDQHRDDQFAAVVEDVVVESVRAAPKWGRTEARLEGARVLLHFGLLESAERELHRSMGAVDRDDDVRARGNLLQVLGQVYRHAGRAADAVAVFTERAELERGRDAPRDLAYALNSLGAAQVDAGEFDAAVQSFRDALALMEEIDDPSGIAVVLNGLALPLHRSGRSEEALAALDRGLAIQHEGARRGDVSVTLNTRGEILRELGRQDEALRDLERCLELSAETDDERGLAFVLPRIGKARLAAGQTEEGLRDLERGTVIAGRNPDRVQRVHALHAFGEGLASVGEEARARDVLREAQALAAGMQDPSLAAAVAGALAAIGSA